MQCAPDFVQNECQQAESEHKKPHPIKTWARFWRRLCLLGFPVRFNFFADYLNIPAHFANVVCNGVNVSLRNF